ncbi:alanine transaminase [Martiniozyma asiatica (nom. inval.)]|nr:alanine transaminase [Martiniozyma asiatica]
MGIRSASRKMSSLHHIAKAEFTPKPKLVDSHLNPHALAAKYAVRGKIPTRAEELREQLQKEPHNVPFKEIINANIGNPQQLDQKPLTFYRQVLSLLEYPELISNPVSKEIYPDDVLARAQEIMSNLSSVGAYSHSKGVKYFRDVVAKFIFERDGFPADPEDIYLTAGASAAVNYLLTLLAAEKNSGFLIPIPQYPLYTASLALNNATVLPYYLNESDNWSVNADELTNIISDANEKGIHTRCLVVINPGNPTGSILTEEGIAQLLNVAAEHGLVVIADEVYQENVYEGEFISIRKVLKKLQQIDPVKYEHVQLASLHSTSKGMIGECGQRGGYMELNGFDPTVVAQILKLASISLCPPVIGQALVSLMVSPPKEGEASFESFHNEKSGIYNALKERSSKLYKAFNDMEGITCQEPKGAMYCYPQITISEKAKEEAEAEGYSPDEFYCAKLLENTGICTVPGSGFGQVEGTFHLRTTFLAPGTKWIEDWKAFHKKFMEEYGH